MNEIGKQGLSLATRSTAFSRFVGLLERFGDRRTDLLRVLTYHRVDERDAHPELNPGLLSATPEDFDRQMEFLAAHYRVISIDELLDVSRPLQNLFLVKPNPPRS